MAQLLRYERALLDKRGALIVRQLCEFLEPRDVFVTLARGLTTEEAPRASTLACPAPSPPERPRSPPYHPGRAAQDLEFAARMVQTLNLIVLTSSEALELRLQLKQSVRCAMVHCSGNGARV